VHPFRAAVEARDWDAAVGLLADDVVFHSPVVFRPYEGRAAVEPLLRAVSQVFEDFSYVLEVSDEGGSDHVLRFQARVGDRSVEGVDILRTGADGRITDFTVMVRPMSGAIALAEAMRDRLAAA
jgi:hypothetical protein